MADFIFVLKSVILKIHEIQIAKHGGALGLRDEGLLDSALSRPQNLQAYGCDDPYILASAYTNGIIRNHPFVDGNKRTAFLAAYIFLRLNGIHLIADEADTVTIIQQLAAGILKEDAFTQWLRENTQ